MNRMTLRERAERIYAQQQQARPQYEKMGVHLPSIMTATVEEIEAHLVFCAELGEANRVNVNADAMWGRTAEEIKAAVEARAAHRRRGAGRRALVNKYGEDSAARIINRAKKARGQE